MKIVFMGTPDFAVPAFERLADEHEVVCVYTREPQIAGRGKLLCKTPIHLAAEKRGVEVRTPKTLRSEEEQQKFAALKADVAVVAAYGLILPLPILTAYPLGCLNIHASLLPRWRGAAPIQRSIEAGDKKSGVTIMQIAEGLDTGDMLLKGEVEITEQTNGEELHDKLSLLGADLISRVLADVNKYTPQPQPEEGVCYAKKLDKAECRLDFGQKVTDLCCKIRAFSPCPAMYFEYENERFKVLAAEVDEIKEKQQCAAVGTIIEGKSSLRIACADGVLVVSKIQRQGKRMMGISELLRGFTFKAGTQV